MPRSVPKSRQELNKLLAKHNVPAALLAVIAPAIMGLFRPALCDQGLWLKYAPTLFDAPSASSVSDEPLRRRFPRIPAFAARAAPVSRDLPASTPRLRRSPSREQRTARRAAARAALTPVPAPAPAPPRAAPPASAPATACAFPGCTDSAPVRHFRRTGHLFKSFVRRLLRPCCGHCFSYCDCLGLYDCPCTDAD